MEQYLKTLEQYAACHSSSDSFLLKELQTETCNTMPGSNMLSGSIVATLLKFLISLTNSTKVLELGTYTGYATLKMAEALPAHGQIITCEIDQAAIAVAKKYFNNSPHNSKITVKKGDALTTLKELSGNFDLAFIDAHKRSYELYYQAVLPLIKSKGVIVIDDVLWRGEVTQPQTARAKSIDQLNKAIIDDNRVENVILPVRNGINIIIKK